MEFSELYMVLEIHERMYFQSNKKCMCLSNLLTCCRFLAIAVSVETLLTTLCGNNVVPWAITFSWSFPPKLTHDKNMNQDL